MKRITFVLIGIIAIVAVLATSKPSVEKEVVQVDTKSLKKQPIKMIYD